MSEEEIAAFIERSRTATMATSESAAPMTSGRGVPLSVVARSWSSVAFAFARDFTSNFALSWSMVCASS